MHKAYGNALTQYGIILLLIALALIPIFFIFGNTIYSSFKSFYDNLNTSNNVTINASKKNGGSIGGTLEQPVKECNKGLCNLDFGEFVLEGIPEDFSEVVRANGISGGSDKLVDLIRQISDQLEKDGKPEESEELKKLASIGHNIAVFERLIEDISKKCNGDETCMKNTISNSSSMPEGYDETFFPFTTNQEITLIDQISIGRKRKELNEETDSFNLKASQNAQAVLFVKQFDSIINSNTSDKVKNVVKELYKEIGKLSEDSEAGVEYILYDDYVKDYTDPITGETITNNDLPDNFSDIYSNYKPSSITHVDSALICATGNYDDTGKKCN